MKKVAAKKVAKNTAVKAAGAPRKSTARPLPQLYYRAHALLNTVRCIAQHEDRLCILLHEMKRRGTVGAAMSKELRTLLGEMPAEEYAVDLRAVEEELG